MVLYVCRTVAIDMRGYGDTEKPVGREAYQMDKLVDDIKGVVDALGKYFKFFFVPVNFNCFDFNQKDVKSFIWWLTIGVQL